MCLKQTTKAVRIIIKTTCCTALKRREELTQDQLRASRYTVKSLTTAYVIATETLPPTRHAADLQSTLSLSIPSGAAVAEK